MELKDTLIDVTHLIKAEDANYFDDDESFDLYQTCIYLMKEFIQEHPTIVSEPDFLEIFDENISEIMHSLFDSELSYTEDMEDEINEIIHQAKSEYFQYYMPLRSYSDSIILDKPNYKFIDNQLQVLRNKPQPSQRTKEWYEFRHGLFTASNAYKAFESESLKNDLIYEKCKPLKEELYTK